MLLYSVQRDWTWFSDSCKLFIDYLTVYMVYSLKYIIHTIQGTNPDYKMDSITIKVVYNNTRKTSTVYIAHQGTTQESVPQVKLGQTLNLRFFGVFFDKNKGSW